MLGQARVRRPIAAHAGSVTRASRSGRPHAKTPRSRLCLQLLRASHVAALPHPRSLQRYHAKSRDPQVQYTFRFAHTIRIHPELSSPCTPILSIRQLFRRRTAPQDTLLRSIAIPTTPDPSIAAVRQQQHPASIASSYAGPHGFLTLLKPQLPPTYSSPPCQILTSSGLQCPPLTAARLPILAHADHPQTDLYRFDIRHRSL